MVSNYPQYVLLSEVRDNAVKKMLNNVTLAARKLQPLQIHVRSNWSLLIVCNPLHCMSNAPYLAKLEDMSGTVDVSCPWHPLLWLCPSLFPLEESTVASSSSSLSSMPWSSSARSTSISWWYILSCLKIENLLFT